MIRTGGICVVVVGGVHAAQRAGREERHAAPAPGSRGPAPERYVGAGLAGIGHVTSLFFRVASAHFRGVPSSKKM